MWVVKIDRSPYFYARFPHPDGSGKLVSLSTKEKTRREAKARAVDIEKEFRAKWQRSIAGAHVSAQAVISDFWDTDASRRKAAKSHVFPHLERIADFLGDRPYADVTIADVASFVDTLDGVVSDSTINRAVSVWRRMHNVAIKKRGLALNAIDWSQVRRDEPVPMSRHIAAPVLRSIFALLPEHALDIAMFALLTGCRKSQVLTLTSDRVDLEGGVCTVWKKHRRAQAPQRIELHPNAVAILAKRSLTPRPDGLMFDDKNFRRHWDSAVKKCGVPGIRFHDLRHTFATMLARNAPLPVVGSQLGHSSPLLTARYAIVQRQDVRAAVSQFPISDVLLDGGNRDAEDL